MFSNEKKADMIFVYGFCNGNATEARRKFKRRFPDRTIPTNRYFGTLYRI